MFQHNSPVVICHYLCNSESIPSFLHRCWQSVYHARFCLGCLTTLAACLSWLPVCLGWLAGCLAACLAACLPAYLPAYLACNLTCLAESERVSRKFCLRLPSKPRGPTLSDTEEGARLRDRGCGPGQESRSWHQA